MNKVPQTWLSEILVQILRLKLTVLHGGREKFNSKFLIIFLFFYRQVHVPLKFYLAKEDYGQT